MESLSPLCIYHGNCADGFGAAWVVRKYFQELRDAAHYFHSEYPMPEFHAGTYQTPPPDVTGRNVIMVDFSYKRPILLEMAEKANAILIIDHHKSAIDDLKDLPKNVITNFDVNHSGAMLTWMHYFGALEAPQLLKIIEDRDLWKFSLGRELVECVQSTIFSHPYDFEIWDKLFTAPLFQLQMEGDSIRRKHFKDIHELLAAAGKFRMVIGGYDVPVANLPYIHSSDAGHIMDAGEAFAACYWDVFDGRIFSLRSSEDGVDVQAVAKQYGGGGHPHAAGFKVSPQHPLAQHGGNKNEASGGNELSTDLQPASGGKKVSS